MQARTASVLAASAAVFGAAALANLAQARAAERAHPPVGHFVEVDGVQVHYVERGRGSPVVFIPGNGSTVEDFLISGHVERFARSHRVIVLDRPGFGHSERPRGLWTARAQGDLLDGVLKRLGVRDAVIVGHSWGTLVSLAIALDHPGLVRALVLLSGYYYPTARADAALFTPPAIPVLGDVLRWTVSPPLARAMYPKMIEEVFAPAPVPERFDRHFPRELGFRPSQLRAASEDTMLMAPSAHTLSERYSELDMPVHIVAGAGDRLVDVDRHPRRLHAEIPGSTLTVLPGIGHFVHQSDPESVSRVIERAIAGESDRSDMIAKSSVPRDRNRQAAPDRPARE